MKNNWTCAYDGTKKKLKDGRCAACGRSSAKQAKLDAKAWDGNKYTPEQNRAVQDLLEANEKLNRKDPYISVFHHRHGISVSVLDWAEDPEKYWVDVDGHNIDRHEEYIEEFPLPDKYIRAVNAHEALLAFAKLVSHNCTLAHEWKREADKAIDKAEAK